MLKLNFISKGALAMYVLLVFPAVVFSGWGIHDLNPLNPKAGINKSLREFDKGRLNTMAPGFRAGRDYTKVYVRNETSRPIWVAVIDMPFDVHQGNVTTFTDPGFDPWHVHAWYKLDPDQRKHVSNTDNRNVYFYAQDDGGHSWTGKTNHSVQDGAQSRMLGFFKESFEGTPEEYTVRFKK